MRASIKFFEWLLAGALACPIAAVSHDSVLAGCKPDHLKPPFFVSSMGVCAFDPETLSYAGTPVQQAMCLMRGMDVSRNLLPRLSSLPASLASRLPSRATLSNYLAQQDPEGALGDYLWLPVSRAHNNDLDSPMARYFVIHETELWPSPLPRRHRRKPEAQRSAQLLLLGRMGQSTRFHQPNRRVARGS